MAGGLLQLAAYGSENQYLNGNPQITFFKAVYRRYSNFAKEHINLVLNGPDNLSKNSSIQLSVKIDRNADLLSNLYLTLDIPHIYSGNTKKFRWVDDLGHVMIDNVKLFIGGTLVETLYGEFLHIHKEMTQNDTHKRLLNRINGNTKRT